ncbi:MULTISPECIES: hypothetical protein [Streptomyces violaceusniger group]|uniref:FXSXX-COOH protein n=4 Tax=Streptomyces violaceusniger group TaxID=2839105 RepID=A0ABN1NWH8_9ACTN|nr:MULTISPECIES: hypothetical protein [Streptomyces violaceusniger group]MBI0320132.1 hypothetical protein [Streptomyces javensis]
MERVATEVETELLDLSGATLEDLERHEGLSAVTERLLDIVQCPPTVGGNSSSSEGCGSVSPL